MTTLSDPATGGLAGPAELDSYRAMRAIDRGRWGWPLPLHGNGDKVRLLDRCQSVESAGLDWVVHSDAHRVHVG